MKVIVKEINQQSFHVTIIASSTTTHEVTVSPSYAKQLCRPNQTTAALIEQSFAFLLARESNTSILRRFDLSVISRYFPEYESEMTKL
jgi:hypothetical protein